MIIKDSSGREIELYMVGDGPGDLELGGATYVDTGDDVPENIAFNLTQEHYMLLSEDWQERCQEAAERAYESWRERELDNE